MLDASGWQALFSTAFKRSRNPMVLADERRITVDANRAFAKLVHRRLSDVIGKPLYSFVQDSPGQVTGNGVSDSFGGTNFTWTAATVGGAPSASGATTTTSGSNGGGYSGGY